MLDWCGYGHVTVVTAVQSTTSIQVSEANYLGQQSIAITVVGLIQQPAQGTVSYLSKLKILEGWNFQPFIFSNKIKYL